MSSSASEGEITVSQTEVTVTKTEVSGNKNDVQNVLVTDITKVSKGVVKSLEGFRGFILRGNVVDLAIGIVIGAAFTSVVTSLVADVITPLIPLPGKNSLASLAISLPSFYPKGSTVQIGLFINAIISFVIVAAVLYFFVVQPVNALMKVYHGKETAAPATRDCPYCYQAVNIKATRCPYCTSHLPADDEKEQGEGNAPVLVLPASLESLSDKLAEHIAKKIPTALEKESESAGSSEAIAEKA